MYAVYIRHDLRFLHIEPYVLGLGLRKVERIGWLRDAVSRQPEQFVGLEAHTKLSAFSPQDETLPMISPLLECSDFEEPK